MLLRDAVTKSKVICALSRNLVLVLLALSQSIGAHAQEGLKVYFGNLHSHTSYSDGSGSPADAYQHARHTAGLDFLAITEHNHAAAESGARERRDGRLIATQPELYNGNASDSLHQQRPAVHRERSFRGSFRAGVLHDFQRQSHECLRSPPRHRRAQWAI